VTVKIGPYFTSLEEVAKEISAAGAKGIVLFNRYYTVDVDPETGRFVPAMTLSAPEEIFQTLRWTGLLANAVECDIAASTGIHDAYGAVKALMAGASAACLCTALYRNGVSYLGTVRDELNRWLDGHGYRSVSDIRGMALREEGSAEVLLHRLQYIKALDEAGKYEG
jgi:dihydroorotate dehydrogenase (fumarate)